MFQAGLDFTYMCFNAIEFVGVAYFLTRGRKIIDLELYEYRRYGFRFDTHLIGLQRIHTNSTLLPRARLLVPLSQGMTF